MHRGWLKNGLVALALALGPASVGAGLPAVVDGEPLPSLAPMLETVLPAVVNISTRGREQIGENPMLRDPFFRHFFGTPDRQPREREISSRGSGVIIDADRGHVVTNQHVIGNADEISVKSSAVTRRRISHS